MLSNDLISFENIHKTNKKCTKSQIAMYQRSLSPHKTINGDLTFETVTVLHQMVCTGKQLRYEIHRDFNGKIGRNNTANKVYPLNGLIGLDLLNLGFVHCKKVMKIQL